MPSVMIGDQTLGEQEIIITGIESTTAKYYIDNTDNKATICIMRTGEGGCLSGLTTTISISFEVIEIVEDNMLYAYSDDWSKISIFKVTDTSEITISGREFSFEGGTYNQYGIGFFFRTPIEELNPVLKIGAITLHDGAQVLPDGMTVNVKKSNDYAYAVKFSKETGTLNGLNYCVSAMLNDTQAQGININAYANDWSAISGETISVSGIGGTQYTLTEDVPSLSVSASITEMTMDFDLAQDCELDAISINENALVKDPEPAENCYVDPQAIAYYSEDNGHVQIVIKGGMGSIENINIDLALNLAGSGDPLVSTPEIDGEHLTVKDVQFVQNNVDGTCTYGVIFDLDEYYEFSKIVNSAGTEIASVKTTGVIDHTEYDMYTWTVSSGESYTILTVFQNPMPILSAIDDIEISEGQNASVPCVLTITDGSSNLPIYTDVPIRIEIYSDGQLLYAKDDTDRQFQIGSLNSPIYLRSLPAGEHTITVKATIQEDWGYDAIATQEFQCVVKASNTLDVEYLKTYGSTTDLLEYGFSATQVGGDLMDAIAFIDPVTGEVTVYGAASSGPVVWKDDGTNALTAMDAEIDRDYFSDSISATGELYDHSAVFMAIGGSSVEDLTAVNAYGQIYRYDSAEESWSLVAGSQNRAIPSGAAREYDTVAAVGGPNDVWYAFGSGQQRVSYHWDGSSWSKTTGYVVNSALRVGADLYLSMRDGRIMKYDSGNLTEFYSYGSSPIDLDGMNSKGDMSFKVMTDNSYTGTLYVKKAGESQPSVTVTGINTSNSYPIDNSGTVYMVPRKVLSGSLYKLSVDGTWEYVNVEAYYDPTEDADYPMTDSDKFRPAAVNSMLNLTDTLTILYGYAGSNYMICGNVTISFETDGGTEVAPITKAVNSAVSAPASPTKSGYVFGGWLLNPDDENSRYTFGRMPGKNITLYANWVEENSGSETDLFATERTQALKSLSDALGRLTRSDYTSDEWAEIQQAYNNGKTGISNATTYDGIYDALNSAIEAMQAVEPSLAGEATVCLSMELFTLDEGYIIEPVLITVDKYEKVSVILTDQLKEIFPSIRQPWKMTGTVEQDFYLSSVWSEQLGWIGEFDVSAKSGWMYSVNNKFPGVSAANYTVVDGDVIRWQYTVEGYGKDLGTSGEWNNGQTAKVANKDALSWKVAEINAEIAKNPDYLEENGLTEAYNNAMTVLTTMSSTQSEVNEALKALKEGGAAGGGEGEPTEGGTAAQRFIDVDEDDWFADAVDYAVENGFMVGTGENTFSPQKTLTRGMLASMLYSMEGAPAEDGTTSFTDVDPSDWFAKGVEWAVENGVAAGYGERFGPNDDITREQMVVMLYGYAKMKGYELVEGEDLSGYEDAGEISSWALPAMQWAKAAGLVSGRSATKMAPLGTTTRAEAATIMRNFLENVAK